MLLFSKTISVSCLILALTNNGITNAQPPDMCGGQCQNGGVCEQGEANFRAHFTPRDHTMTAEEGNLEALPIHTETTIEGTDYHCDCPPGWTGVRCDIRFEACSQQQDAGEHHCYHGGRCIEGLIDKYGNDQLYCDCSNAYDANDNVYYVGKYCEHRSINYCDNANTQFCVNGGECNDEYGLNGDDSGPPCICNGEFTGPHCEFKTSSVPVCDLSCQNGGQCVFGEPDSRSEDRYQYWATGNKEDYMHCSCPDNFDGPTCEIQKDICGKGHCFHGSTCIEDEDMGYYCDCESANAFADENYAGRYCQYQATSYCSKDGEIFCVNGGTCPTDPSRLHEGCDCLPGFEGFSCEFQVNINTTHHGEDIVDRPTFPIIDNDGDGFDNEEIPTDNFEVFLDDGDDEDYDDYDEEEEPVGHVHYDEPDYVLCDLRCENHGVCRKGSKAYSSELNTIIHDVDHFNVTHTEEFEHCVCPMGFIGLRCEHQIETCGANEHHCLHGSQCVSNGDVHSCDCSNTTSPGVFAGASCEHRASTICSEGINDDVNDYTHPPPVKPLSFCVNGGQCVREVPSGERHPGCLCLPGYDGPHCEIKVEIDQEQMFEDELELDNQQQQQQQQNHDTMGGPDVTDLETNQSLEEEVEQQVQEEINSEEQQLEEEEDDQEEEEELPFEQEEDDENDQETYAGFAAAEEPEDSNNADQDAITILGIFFGVFAAVVGLLVLYSIHVRKQKQRQKREALYNAHNISSFRDNNDNGEMTALSSSAPNLTPLRDGSDDGGMPQRAFTSSSYSADRHNNIPKTNSGGDDHGFVDVMESSDLTPLATSNGFGMRSNNNMNNGNVGGGGDSMMMMESSDTTPEVV